MKNKLTKVKEKIIRGDNITRYLQLRKKGWLNNWSGENKISLIKPIEAEE